MSQSEWLSIGPSRGLKVKRRIKHPASPAGLEHAVPGFPPNMMNIVRPSHPVASDRTPTVGRPGKVRCATFHATSGIVAGVLLPLAEADGT